jgi:hypothetical protein
MIRHLLPLALVLLVLPRPADAQIHEPLPQSRFAISPFVGYRVSFRVTGNRVWEGENGPVGGRFEETRNGGAAVGAEAEMRLTGPFHLIGALAYSRPDSITGTIRLAQGEASYETDGARVWFARAGLAYRLPDPDPDRRRFRPAGFIFAAPALVRESSAGADLFSPDADGRSIDHWAINLGANVVAPLGSPRVAFLLGLEDFITFWNTDELERRFENAYGAPAHFAFDQSHILLLRAGISLRF